MDNSVFLAASEEPTSKMLITALGESYAYWNEIAAYVKNNLPGTVEEWKFSGAKYGWSFRLKDKKRVVIYLLPRHKAMKISMVFGQKATNAVMESNVREEIKRELAAAKVYVEGRGIKIDVDSSTLNDIKTLIDIKMRN